MTSISILVLVLLSFSGSLLFYLLFAETLRAKSAVASAASAASMEIPEFKVKIEDMRASTEWKTVQEAVERVDQMQQEIDKALKR